MTTLTIILWILAGGVSLLVAKYLKSWVAVAVAVAVLVVNYFLIPFALSAVVWSNRWLPEVMRFFVYFTFLLPFVLGTKVLLNKGLPYILRLFKTSKSK